MGRVSKTSERRTLAATTAGRRIVVREARVPAGAPAVCAAARPSVVAGVAAVALLLLRIGVAPATTSAADDAVEVGLEAPAPRVVTVSSAGLTWHQVTVAGFEAVDRPGFPALPVHRVLLGIPARGRVELAVTVSATRTFGADLRIVPAAAASPVDVGDAAASGPRMRIAPDAAAYASHDWYPAAQAEVIEEGWLRDLRFVRLELHPYRYRPSDGTLVWNESMRVTVRFADDMPATPGSDRARQTTAAAGAAGAAGASSAAAVAGDPFDTIIDAVVFNAEQARRWRTGRGPAAPPPGPPLPPPANVPLLSLAVAETGIVRVTGAVLRSASWPLDSIDPHRVALFDRGQEVAIRVDGDADGRFDDGDGFTFYGTASTSRYSAQHIYQLAHVDRPGRRMAAQLQPPSGLTAADAVTVTVRIEENETYVSDLPRDWTSGEPAFESTVDRWYGSLLTAPAVVTRSLALPLAAPGGWTGQLRVAAVGKTAFSGDRPDHALSVRIGRSTLGVFDLGTHRWDGNDRVVSATFAVPSHALSNRGADVDVAIEAPGDTGAVVDQVYLDWLSLTYRREPLATDDRLAFTADGAAGDVPLSGFTGPPTVFDVSDARAPRVVEGMAVERGARGWGARFRPPSDVPRAYEAVAADGIAAPVAVWPQPAVAPVRVMAGADYVVIAHPAFLGPATRLATFRQQQGHRTHVVDVMALYAAYSGGMPEPAAIQRFLAEAYATWDRPPLYVLLLGDASSDPRGNLVDGTPAFIPTFLRVADPWLGEVATDNAFARVSGTDPMPDLAIGRLPVSSGAEADALVDKIIAYERAAPNGDWRSMLLFVADAPDGAGDFYGLSDRIAADHVPRGYRIDKVYHKQTHPDRAQARVALLAALDRGALIVQYIGHGRTASWSADALLRRTDVPAMANGPRLPIMLDMTCMTGRFSEPLTRSLAEEAVRKVDGGAIAAFAPTGFGVATGHDTLNRMFFDAVLDLGIQPLGAVVLASKARLFVASTRDRDLLETYVLLGDPALKVRLPEALAAGTPVGSAATATSTDAPTAVPTEVPTGGPATAPIQPSSTHAAPPTGTPSPPPSAAPSNTPAMPTAYQPPPSPRPVYLPRLSSDGDHQSVVNEP